MAESRRGGGERLGESNVVCCVFYGKVLGALVVTTAGNEHCLSSQVARWQFRQEPTMCVVYETARKPLFWMIS